MIALPANIDMTQAKLPAVYEQAKAILAQCEQIDECQDWANKAEALASYAKMADDDSLRSLADRIQARAVRRMGELLKEFNAQGRRTDKLPDGAVTKLTQEEAADAAHISERQRVTAVRVANIPEDKFEAAVDGPKPPTVTGLAEIGKKTRATAKPRTKIAQARLDGFFGTAAGLLSTLEGLENKPDTITLIVQELIDNPEERRNIEALQKGLNRLLGMAKAQKTQSQSTVPPAAPSIATAPRAEMPDIPAFLDRRAEAEAIAATGKAMMEA